MSRPLALALAASILAGWVRSAPGAEPVGPAGVRYGTEAAASTEIPDFQRHVLPMMGRVGCNTRSCHGSFQGQGGLRLSLFGYDFAADRDTLIKADSGRVVLDNPEASKILAKPTLSQPHKGGKRLEIDTWQYRLLVRWIEAGAKGVGADTNRFDRLEVTPAGLAFTRAGEKIAVKVVAHWGDGSSEDVTCLTRFRTNDESIADVAEDGTVTSTGPGDTHIIAFYDNGVASIPAFRAVSNLIGDSYPSTPTPTKVDELVVAKLRQLGIAASPVCTDAEFLRRVSFDLTGTAPAPAEVESFLADPSSDKRSRKVDEMLGRPTYAAWWTTKLCDYTGAAPQTLNQLQWGNLAPRQWYEWIYKRVADNTPYDGIVGGLILGTSREEGETYDDYVKRQAEFNKDKPALGFADRDTMPHYWARTNFRKPEERVIGLSYAFLGVRLECAQCHKHPFDQWTQGDFNRFGAFFNTIGVGVAPESREANRKLTEELGLNKLMGGERNKKIYELRREGKDAPWQEVFVNRTNRPTRVAGANKVNPAGNARPTSAKVLGGDEMTLASTDDPRALVMDWLRSPSNPYFARAFVNRVWANDFGSGIVNPPDDMNMANPPSNAPLLDYLANGFVSHEFDMKWLHREILNSQTYQRSWKTEPSNAGDERNFSHAIIRRLPAEVLIDALAQATANTPTLAKAASDVDTRAIGPRLPAGRGRAITNYANKVFGASTRETNCDCNRSDEPNLLQSIYLQNDNELFATIDRADGWLAERTKSAKSGPVAKGQGDVEAATGLNLAELERRLKEAQAANQALRIERLEARIKAVRDQMNLAKPTESLEAPKPAPAPALTSDDRDAIVREAYLRTLGRTPGPPEAQAATKYLAGAPDTTRGLRDLLWALLNTKEFATNH